MRLGQQLSKWIDSGRHFGGHHYDRQGSGHGAQTTFTSAGFLLWSLRYGSLPRTSKIFATASPIAHVLRDRHKALPEADLLANADLLLPLIASDFAGLNRTFIMPLGDVTLQHCSEPALGMLLFNS